ncbi:MAG: hypothetical protein IPJ58_07695 [Ardenticatenia bacterium]|nr:hypothetical protein [Ardenticatenia bacterium]
MGASVLEMVPMSKPSELPPLFASEMPARPAVLMPLSRIWQPVQPWPPSCAVVSAMPSTATLLIPLFMTTWLSLLSTRMPEPSVTV